MITSNPAPTQHPVIEEIKQRWSPRAFTDKAVEPEKLRSMFEAARWAASSYNEQPWRYLVATRENPADFDKMLSCLVEQNQAWAKAAPVLCLTAVSTKFKKNGKDNRVALHDLGAASAHLALEATRQGLVIHQMAGVDLDKARETYNIPADYEPATGIAIGYPGEADTLPEDWMRQAEKADRSRSAFNDFVFGNGWENPSGLF